MKILLPPFPVQEFPVPYFQISHHDLRKPKRMKILIPSISCGKKTINNNREKPKKTVRFPLLVAVFLSLVQRGENNPPVQKDQKAYCTAFLPFCPLPYIFCLLALGCYLSGCSNQPTNAELENLRQEAIAHNQEFAKRYGKKLTQPNWQFRIQGQIKPNSPVALSWSKLETLAKTTVETTDPHHTSDRKAKFEFQGVPISTLLKEFGVAPDVEDVTFVAYDAYRSTVSLSDLRQYPILLALKRNHQKIARSDGGPVYLVFPQTDFPQLKPKYPDRFWAFYVTDMIVGTEPIKLQVGQRILDAAALDKLPPITIEETVGYRLGWPVGKVKLYGVRLTDVLDVAGVKLPQRGAVIVRGKSPIYHNSANPIRIQSADVKRCDIVLATHWGDERKPIPARMGGPVTLAFTSECQTPSDERRWVTFVEKLEVRK